MRLEPAAVVIARFRHCTRGAIRLLLGHLLGNLLEIIQWKEHDLELGVLVCHEVVIEIIAFFLLLAAGHDVHNIFDPTLLQSRCGRYGAAMSSRPVWIGHVAIVKLIVRVGIGRQTLSV